MDGGLNIGNLGFLKSQATVQSEQTTLLLIPCSLLGYSPYKNVALVLKIVIAYHFISNYQILKAILSAINIISKSLNNRL